MFEQEVYGEASRIMQEIKYQKAKPEPGEIFSDVIFTNLNDMDTPMFVLTAPNYAYIDEDYPLNNKYMELMFEGKDKIVTDKYSTYTQWKELYQILSQYGIVFIQPMRDKKTPDLNFTANAGVFLPHHIAPYTFIASNFRSEPRAPELQYNKEYFKSLGYRVVIPPTFFEGYADIKYLKDNIFIAGYGMRSQLETYEWMMDNWDMKIIPTKINDPELYHEDCNVLVVDQENVVVSRSLSKEDIKLIEKYASVHMVSVEDARLGTTNSIMADGVILNASDLMDLEKSDPYYIPELKRTERLNRIAYNIGYNIAYINLDSYYKFGASLSCLVLPINYPGQE